MVTNKQRKDMTFNTLRESFQKPIAPFTAGLVGFDVGLGYMALFGRGEVGISLIAFAVAGIIFFGSKYKKVVEVEAKND